MFKFTIGGLTEFRRQLITASSQSQNIMKRGLQTSADVITEEAKRNAPVGVSVPGLRKSITNKLISWNKAEIGTFKNIKHGAFVEFGTKPHWPPTYELEKWARLKLGASNPKSAAFLIARKISRVGTKAQPYLYPAFDTSMNEVRSIIDRSYADVITILKR